MKVSLSWFTNKIIRFIIKGKGSNLALNYCQKYTPHKSESRSSNLALIKYKLGQM